MSALSIPLKEINDGKDSLKEINTIEDSLNDPLKETTHIKDLRTKVLVFEDCLVEILY